jgi:hypothetical protein
LEWTHEGQVVILDLDAGQDVPAIHRLLSALHLASDVPLFGVEMREADLVPDVDNPEYQLGPCNKLINRYTHHQWDLSLDRLNLWTILARHYMHAHNKED